MARLFLLSICSLIVYFEGTEAMFADIGHFNVLAVKVTELHFAN